MFSKRSTAPIPVKCITPGVALLFSAIILSSNIQAQTAERDLTLAKALELASSNFGEIKVKEFYAQAQEENTKQVRRQYIPSVKLYGQVNYGTANSVPGSYFSNGFSTSGSINPANNFTPVYGAIGMGYIEWVPFTFGQYTARVKESDLQFQLAGADAEQEKFFNKVYVTQAYLDALVATRLRLLQEANLKRLIQVHDVISANAKSGLRAGVDTSFANAELAKARLIILEAEKNEAEQRSRLAGLMGVPFANYKLDTGSFFLTTPNSPLIAPADISSNPALKLFDARLGLSEIREKEILRNYFPRISVLGVTNGRGSGIGSSGQYNETVGGGTELRRFNYAAGIVCSFNILDYPRMKAEQAAQHFRTDAAKTELETQKLYLKNDMELANSKLLLSIEQLKQAPIQYASATDFYRQKLSMYQNGLCTVLDLSQALYNLSRAEADNAIARDGVWKAVLLKASISGDFNTFLNSTNIK
jgi:outer membrane protein TolC